MTRPFSARGVGAGIVLALLAVIAGCSSDDDTESVAGSGAVTSDSAGSQDAVEPASEVEIIAPNFPQILDALAATLGDDFTARTGISVEVLAVGDTSYDGVDQRIQSDLVAGNEIDMAVIGLNSIRTYADAERAQPLDDLIDGDPTFDRADYYPTLFELGERAGSLYGLPYGVSTYTLYYNTAIFEAAGLDPNAPPETFSELRAASEAVLGAGAAEYGIVIRADHAGDYAFQNFITSAGGGFMDAEEEAVTFNGPAGRDVIQFWADLHADGLGRTMSNDQVAEAFLRGSAAMMLQSSSYTANLETNASFPTMSAPFPIPDGGERRAVSGGAALAMFTGDPAKQAAVWEVMSALLSPEGVTDLVTHSGFSPVNRVAAEDEAFLAGYLDEHPLASAGWEQLEFLAPWYRYPGPSAVEISQIMQDEIGLAITGDKSVQDALDDAASQAESLLP
jgi:multiple sugar transport system substrate-binding protein